MSLKRFLKREKEPLQCSIWRVRKVKFLGLQINSDKNDEFEHPKFLFHVYIKMRGLIPRHQVHCKNERDFYGIVHLLIDTQSFSALYNEFIF